MTLRAGETTIKRFAPQIETVVNIPNIFGLVPAKQAAELSVVIIPKRNEGFHFITHK
jgi:hypothetical protein